MFNKNLYGIASILFSANSNLKYDIKIFSLLLVIPSLYSEISFLKLLGLNMCLHIYIISVIFCLYLLIIYTKYLSISSLLLTISSTIFVISSLSSGIDLTNVYMSGLLFFLKSLLSPLKYEYVSSNSLL